MGSCTSSSSSATIVASVRNTHVYVRFTTFVSTPWCASSPNGTKTYTLEEELTSVQCASLSDALFKLRCRQVAEIRYASMYSTRSEITYIFTRNALTQDDVCRLAQLPLLNYVDVTVENSDHALTVLRAHPKVEVLVINGVQHVSHTYVAEMNQLATRNTPGGTVPSHMPE